MPMDKWLLTADPSSGQSIPCWLNFLLMIVSFVKAAADSTQLSKSFFSERLEIAQTIWHV